MNPRTLSAVDRIGRKIAALQGCSPSIITVISFEMNSGKVPVSARSKVGVSCLTNSKKSGRNSSMAFQYLSVVGYLHKLVEL